MRYLSVVETCVTAGCAVALIALGIWQLAPHISHRQPAPLTAALSHPPL